MYVKFGGQTLYVRSEVKHTLCEVRGQTHCMYRSEVKHTMSVDVLLLVCVFLSLMSVFCPLLLSLISVLLSLLFLSVF